MDDTDPVTKYASLTVGVTVTSDDGEFGMNIVPAGWADAVTTSPLTLGDMVAMAQSLAQELSGRLATGYALEGVRIIGTVRGTDNREITAPPAS